MLFLPHAAATWKKNKKQTQNKPYYTFLKQRFNTFPQSPLLIDWWGLHIHLIGEKRRGKKESFVFRWQQKKKTYTALGVVLQWKMTYTAEALQEQSLDWFKTSWGFLQRCIIRRVALFCRQASRRKKMEQGYRALELRDKWEYSLEMNSIRACGPAPPTQLVKECCMWRC